MIDKSKILAEQLLQIHEENLGYDEELRRYIKAIGEFRAEIEKESVTRDKVFARANENIITEPPAPRIFPTQRIACDTIIGRAEREFDDSEKIGEL